MAACGLASSSRALAALEVGVEAEPARVDAAEQHHARRRMTVGRAAWRRSSRRAAAGRARRASSYQRGELHERIGIEIGFVQRTRVDGHGKPRLRREGYGARMPFHHVALATRDLDATCALLHRGDGLPAGEGGGRRRRSSRPAGRATCSSTPATVSCSRCGTSTTTPSPTSIPRSAAASACPLGEPHRVRGVEPRRPRGPPAAPPRPRPRRDRDRPRLVHLDLRQRSRTAPWWSSAARHERSPRPTSTRPSASSRPTSPPLGDTPPFEIFEAKPA